MRSWINVLAIAAGSVVSAGPVSAQVLPHESTYDIAVCDSDTTQLVRLMDLTQDGKVNEPNGFAVTFDAAIAGSIALQSPCSIAFDRSGWQYTSDFSADIVMRTLDQNGEGDANDAGEWSVFIDNTNASGIAFTSALVIRADAQGGIVGINSGNNAHPLDFVWRAFDLNQDGDAQDISEITIVYDSVAGPFNIAVPFGLCIEPSTGDLLVADVNPDAVYRMHDANLDGDYYDAGETTIAYNSPVGSPAIKNVNTVQFAADGALFMNDATADFILRGVDGNADGDWNDAGEMAIFADKTGNSFGVPANHFGIEVDEAGRVFAVENSAADMVVRYADLNGDFDAQDPGEVVKIYEGSVGPGTVSTLRNIALIPAPRLAAPAGNIVSSPGLMQLEVYGAESSPYQLLFGVVPIGFNAQVPPYGVISYIPITTLWTGTIPAGGVDSLSFPIPAGVPTPLSITFSAAVGGPFRTYLSNEQVMLFP